MGFRVLGFGLRVRSRFAVAAADVGLEPAAVRATMKAQSPTNLKSKGPLADPFFILKFGYP